MSKVLVGIDVSKKELSITMIIDDKSYYCSVANSKDGFKNFSLWLNSHKVDKVTACMEATGIYGIAIADYLFKQNHLVSIVNPACINAFAKSKLSRHKNDRVDSKIIAEYAGKYELKSYIPSDPTILELRNIYDCIENLKDQYRKLQNYLECREHLASEVVKTYEKLCASLLKEIEKLEQKIDEILDNNVELKEKVGNIQTIPGIGKKTAVAVISSVSDMKVFKNGREFAAFAGLTPREYQSGTSVKKRSRISKIGSSRLRKALYFPAMSAMQHNPLMKNFAAKLKLSGKCGKVILVAIMRKLAHIIFGLIKHNTIFDINAVNVRNA